MTTTERVLTAIGLMTWLASGIPNTLFFLSPQGAGTPGAVPWAVAFLLFGACFWVMTRTEWHPRVLMCVASALGLSVATFGRSGFEPILLVIVAAVGGGLLRVSGFALLIATQTSLLAGIELMRFGTRALPTVGAYAGFMVFAAITAMIAENERRARAAGVRSHLTSRFWGSSRSCPYGWVRAPID